LRYAAVVTTCEQCGRHFEEKHLGRPAKFCSDGCRQAAFRGRKADGMGVFDTEVAEVLARARETTGGHYPSSYPDAQRRAADDEALDAYADESAAQFGKAVVADELAYWLRTGEVRQVRSRTGVKSAIVADSTGAILLPKDISIDVLSVARGAGMLRDLVTVRPTQMLKQPVGTLSAAATGWGRLEIGTTPTDANIGVGAPVGGDLEVFDLNSLVKIGVDVLDDTPAATNAMLTEVLGEAVAEAEDTAIAAGTGSGQPRGITLAANVTAIPAANKTTAGASNTPTLADMLAVPWTLPDRYRPRASWLIHPKAAAKIAALTYTNGSPLWPNPGNPSAASGGGLLGWDSYVVPSLPDPSTAGVTDASVLFGDWKSAYRLVDRRRVTVQRLTERYLDAGMIGLLLRHWIAGDLIRPAAASVYLL
jgi:HK97 family phage major capsid protein